MRVVSYVCLAVGMVLSTVGLPIYLGTVVPLGAYSRWVETLGPTNNWGALNGPQVLYGVLFVVGALFLALCAVVRRVPVLIVLELVLVVSGILAFFTIAPEIKLVIRVGFAGLVLYIIRKVGGVGYLTLVDVINPWVHARTLAGYHIARISRPGEDPVETAGVLGTEVLSWFFALLVPEFLLLGSLHLALYSIRTFLRNWRSGWCDVVAATWAVLNGAWVVIGVIVVGHRWATLLF